MSRNILKSYFDVVERWLLNLPNIYVEQFNATILTAERANLRLRIRFKGKYLLAISCSGSQTAGMILANKEISGSD